MSRHQHHHHNKHSHTEERPRRYRPSKWLIIGVIIMLIGMVIYVLTMDESVVPVLQSR